MKHLAHIRLGSKDDDDSFHMPKGTLGFLSLQKPFVMQLRKYSFKGNDGNVWDMSMLIARLNVALWIPFIITNFEESPFE